MPSARRGGGFDEFLIATIWLVLQLGGGRSKYTQNGWSNFAMDHLLAGPCFGREWKNVLDAQCQAGGFDEFLIATNWLVLQLGGRSTYTQNGWSNFAMADLLPGPCWPLLCLGSVWGACGAPPSAPCGDAPWPCPAKAVGAAKAAGVRVLGCRSTAKGLPKVLRGRHFFLSWRLAVYGLWGGGGGGAKLNHHGGPLGVQKLRKPLSFGCIFSPLSAPLAPRAFFSR
jgi:hypothetical protein